MKVQKMSERAKTTGGPAFPGNHSYIDGMAASFEGMSLRFRTAIAAMQGLLAADTECGWKPAHVAESAFAIADAMIARAEETDPKIDRNTDDDLPF